MSGREVYITCFGCSKISKLGPTKYWKNTKKSAYSESSNAISSK